MAGDELEGAKGADRLRDKYRGSISTAFGYGAQTDRNPRGQSVNPTIPNGRTRNVSVQPAPFTTARGRRDSYVPTPARKIPARVTRDGLESTIADSKVAASPKMKHPGPLTSHPTNRPSALPLSQSHGSMNAYQPGPRLKTSNTSSALPLSQSHGNMNAYQPGPRLKTSNTYSNLPVPSDKYRSSPPKVSVAKPYNNALAIPPRNVENIPPGTAKASIGTDKQTKLSRATAETVPELQPTTQTKSRFRPGLPKSRTFTAWSNLTASLSRTSLGLSGSDSRRTSTSSRGTTRKDLASDARHQLASSTSSKVFQRSGVDKTDPRNIHTAQSSAYWAGRFMALHDRFQSELLLPENLQTLIDEHASHSLLPITQPSLASSATTGCIVTESTSPHKPQQQPKWQSKYGPEAIAKALHSKAKITSAQPSTKKTAAMLVDEDDRCRRIFLYLEALCTTNEARASLRDWQQAYARRTGKENLLPKGGTMQGTTRDLKWVGRLFSGNGGSHTKRGSLGM
ncbi:hypothetical protein GGR50DRAFT_326161 [Xylaria sp. CBS 124048]|nr:hypothetical protein GGR50DRAFT_326161 [Xylaria sp. CBS 124048]